MRQDFSKIFVLSRQKCATTSTGDFLRHHGLSCAGADGTNNRIWGVLALSGQHEDIFNSQRFQEHQAFEDDPWWMRGMADILVDKFPDGLYILVERDADQWFDSMIAHSKSVGLGFSAIHLLEYERGEDLANYLLNNRVVIQNERAFPLTEEHRAHYTRLYRERLGHTLQLFEESGLNERLCHVQLSDPEKWQKIGRFLDLETDPNIDVQSNRKDKRKPRKSGFATRFIVSMKAFRLAWKGLKSPLS